MVVVLRLGARVLDPVVARVLEAGAEAGAGAEAEVVPIDREQDIGKAENVVCIQMLNTFPLRTKYIYFDMLFENKTEKNS